jgi:hypothetical protein
VFFFFCCYQKRDNKRGIVLESVSSLRDMSADSVKLNQSKKQEPFSSFRGKSKIMINLKSKLL